MERTLHLEIFSFKSHSSNQLYNISKASCSRILSSLFATYLLIWHHLQIN